MRQFVFPLVAFKRFPLRPEVCVVPIGFFMLSEKRNSPKVFRQPERMCNRNGVIPVFGEYQNVIRHGRKTFCRILDYEFMHQTLDHRSHPHLQRFFPNSYPVPIIKPVLLMEFDYFMRKVPKETSIVEYIGTMDSVNPPRLRYSRHLRYQEIILF